MNTRFQAKGTTAEIWLYDQIGESVWGDGISAKAFQKELTALGKVNTINLRINSPGGNVFDGLAIYNLLTQHPARVIVDVDGLAASIASVIAMAGDEVRMASNALMMIHNPHGMAAGDDREMERMAALLKQVKASLVDTYAASTSQQQAQIAAWMDDETWMSADTAVQNGFADEISAAQQVAASFRLLKDFKHTPAALLAQSAPDDARPARDMLAVRNAQLAQRLSALGVPQIGIRR